MVHKNQVYKSFQAAELKTYKAVKTGVQKNKERIQSMHAAHQLPNTYTRLSMI